ncbi:MAG: kinase [Desulfobacteraceae bacterium]|nr:kinase [Desulfobacteraceae bacterium]
MIISRTPFRISFFGGGTDYPSWYLKNGGQVISSTIDKYCYLTLRYLPPFFEHHYRVVYSKMENVKQIKEIQHPIVREILQYLRFDRNLEIHHDGDLPARSGMGSSSSFAVGLLNALDALNGSISDKMDLATRAIHVEQDLVGDTVGSQDQTAVAFGGLNKIIFQKDGQIEVKPITIHMDRRKELNDNLMLFYTGIMRTASNIAKSYVTDIKEKERCIFQMHEMVDEAMKILSSDSDLSAFGELMNLNWQAKKRISEKISNSYIDGYYQKAMNAGALGGKITGAGGGGFLLFFVPKEQQANVREALCDLLHIPFRFEFNGSQIIFYDPNVDDFRHINDERECRDFNEFVELSKLKMGNNN